MTGRLANPTLQRWLPVIVLPPILLLDGLLSADGDPVDLLSVLFAYVAALPLLWRVELPFAAMAPLLVAGIVIAAFGLHETLAHVHDPLDDVPAFALVGGVAIYLLGHVALRLRGAHTLNRRRLVLAFVMLALMPLLEKAGVPKGVISVLPSAQ